MTHSEQSVCPGCGIWPSGHVVRRQRTWHADCYAERAIDALERIEILTRTDERQTRIHEIAREALKGCSS